MSESEGTGECIMDPDMQGLVLEFGSGMMKEGFAGDDAPRAVFPTIVGRPRHPGIMVGMDAKDCFVGDEAQAKRGILNLTYPVQGGTIQDWKDVEKILHHSCYNELCVCPEEQYVVIGSFPIADLGSRLRPLRSPFIFEFSPFLSEASLLRLAPLLFETFNCPFVTVQNSPLMSLLASGRETGVVVDCGTMSSTVCCFKKQVLHKETVLKGPIGGAQISSLLTDLLADAGYEMTTKAEREIVRDIKEKKCLVSPTAYDEAADDDEPPVKYELPDGTMMSFPKRMAYTATESLFQPSIFYEKIKKKTVAYMKTAWPSLPPAWTGEKEDEDVSLGIADLIHKSITMAPMEDRAVLMRNICLAGGTTMFEGFHSRVENDLRDLFGAHSDFKVICPPERKYTGWIGGSIFGSLSATMTDGSLWANTEEYDDEGPRVLLRKFGKNFAGREEEDVKKQ